MKVRAILEWRVCWNLPLMTKCLVFIGEVPWRYLQITGSDPFYYPVDNSMLLSEKRMRGIDI